MKPDWKDAPEWAKYLAMDSDGSWAWFEYEPCRGESLWFNVRGNGGLAVHRNSWWKDSLEQRPETSGTTSGGTP